MRLIGRGVSAGVNARFLKPVFERCDRTVDQQRLGIVLDLGGFGPTETFGETGNEREGVVV